MRLKCVWIQSLVSKWGKNIKWEARVTYRCLALHWWPAVAKTVDEASQSLPLLFLLIGEFVHCQMFLPWQILFFTVRSYGHQRNLPGQIVQNCSLNLELLFLWFASGKETYASNVFVSCLYDRENLFFFLFLFQKSIPCLIWEFWFCKLHWTAPEIHPRCTLIKFPSESPCKSVSFYISASV